MLLLSLLTYHHLRVGDLRPQAFGLMPKEHAAGTLELLNSKAAADIIQHIPPTNAVAVIEAMPMVKQRAAFPNMQVS